MREVGAVVEGWYACRSARELAEELGVEMPICRGVYDVLFNGADVAATVTDALGVAFDCAGESFRKELTP